MSQPESDPNESVEISGADFSIMCDELDSLKARIAELEALDSVSTVARQMKRIAELEAERDAALKDAERYRYLRTPHPGDWQVLQWANPCACYIHLDWNELDAAIDAAMAKGE